MGNQRHKHWVSGPPSQSPGAATLRRLYLREELSYVEIARLYDVTPTAVMRWCRKAGISARSTSEATKMGRVGWKPTEEHKDKLRESVKKAHVASQNPESRAKQSAKMKGRIPWNKGKSWSEETRVKHMAYRQTAEYRQRLSDLQKGEKAHNWQGGITKMDERLRGWQWRELRRKVYERDKWTCQKCGVHCTNKRQAKNSPTARIQAHHIVARRDGGLDEMDNLVTLCMSCHMKREWENRRVPKE